MALRAVVVDDEPLARRELGYLLGRAGVDVVAEAANGIEAVELIRTHPADVLFLDVQMPGLDGFALLKKLLARGVDLPEVVFATAFDQYALRAFEVNAIDYLLKPFDQRHVDRAVEKVRQRRTPRSLVDVEGVPQADPQARLEALLKLLEQQAAQPAPAQPAAVQRPRSGKIALRAAQRVILVEPREICFANIQGGVITVCTRTLEATTNLRTLEELAEQLDPERFWRAHRSYLVAVQHIREVVPWNGGSGYLLRMDDRRHSEIPVARREVKRLRELFKI